MPQMLTSDQIERNKIAGLWCRWLEYSLEEFYENGLPNPTLEEMEYLALWETPKGLNQNIEIAISGDMFFGGWVGFEYTLDYEIKNIKSGHKFYLDAEYGPNHSAFTRAKYVVEGWKASFHEDYLESSKDYMPTEEMVDLLKIAKMENIARYWMSNDKENRVKAEKRRKVGTPTSS